MKKISFLILLFLVGIGAGCSTTENVAELPAYRSNVNSKNNYNRYNVFNEPDYDDGYVWAEDNDITNFDECQDEFHTSEAEDGCNDYIKDNYTGHKSFYGYDCTEDCGGHQAGYDWAEENGIYDIDDCYGNSQSFEEGCSAYVEENY